MLNGREFENEGNSFHNIDFYFDTTINVHLLNKDGVADLTNFQNN